jgi:hypothetical protein
MLFSTLVAVMKSVEASPSIAEPEPVEVALIPTIAPTPIPDTCLSANQCATVNAISINGQLVTEEFLLNRNTLNLEQVSFEISDDYFNTIGEEQNETFVLARITPIFDESQEIAIFTVITSETKPLIAGTNTLEINDEFPVQSQTGLTGFRISLLAHNPRTNEESVIALTEFSARKNTIQFPFPSVPTNTE